MLVELVALVVIVLVGLAIKRRLPQLRGPHTGERAFRHRLAERCEEAFGLKPDIIHNIGLGSLVGQIGGFEVNISAEARLGRVWGRLAVDGTGKIPPRMAFSPKEQLDLSRVHVGDDVLNPGICAQGSPEVVLACLDQVTRESLNALVREGETTPASAGWTPVVSVVDGRVFARFNVALLDQPDAFEWAVGQVVELARRLCIPRERIPERLLANFRGEPRDDLRLRFLDTLLHAFGTDGPGGVAAEEGSRDRDPRIRLRAANALGTAGYGVLQRLVSDETVIEDVRIQALRSLVLAAPGRGRPLVVDLLQHGSPTALRRAAVELAGRPLGVTEALQTIALMAEGSDSLTAAAVARTLGLLGSPEAEPALLTLLQRPERDVQLAAARALGEVGTVGAVEILLALSQHRGTDPTLKEVAAEALARIQGKLGPVERGRLSVVDPAELGGNLSLAAEAGAGALSMEAGEAAQATGEEWLRELGQQSEVEVEVEAEVAADADEADKPA